MNFSPHSSNYNSASQQQSQQQTMNTYNNGSFYPNMVPTFTGYPYYTNNFPYAPVNYPAQQSGTYNQNQYTYSNNIPSKTTDVPKREFKPLIVFDPQKNEAIDLVEASKTSKSSPSSDKIRHDCANSKVSVSLTAVLRHDKDKTEFNDQMAHNVLYRDELDEVEDNDDDDEDIDQDDHEVSHHDDDDVTEEDTYESSDQCPDGTNLIQGSELVDSEERCNENVSRGLHSDSVQPIKYSLSIPNKMETLSNSNDGIHQLEMSSSENNLHVKSVSQSDKELEKSRLTYDRKTLLKISKSPLCRKPVLDCKDIIENQSIKNYTSVFHSKTLERTKHGYLPPHLRIKEECSQNQYLESIRRSFKCILNKIAPQNFDACFSDIKSLIIDTDWTTVSIEEGMDCLIEEIFDKAVKEEAYSVTYADLCTKIVFYEDKQETQWSFKKSLINRCKEMFEKPLQDQLKAVREHWEQKTEKEKDEKLKNLYKSDIEEQVKKAKDKYFGNIRFIGELYLHYLLKPNIINICVHALMSKRNDEDALFSLCKLLETVGKKFDTEHNDKMKEYIKTITEIADTEELPSRIKFRLIDIIEMSERNWTLRTIQVQKMIQPKTLEQVKKDNLDEKSQEASKLSNKSQTRLNKKNINSADIKFKPQQNKMQSLEISSLQMQPNNDIQLKPSYGLWKSGSGVKDSEWKDVEGGKKNQRFNKHPIKHAYQNNKYSPVTSRDESPSKIVDIGGRFALLPFDDFENSMDNKDLLESNTRDAVSDSEKQRQNDLTSSSSTREQSPVNLEYANQRLLDGKGILKDLLDGGCLDVNSWCQLNDVSGTVANWIDSIMEKNKLIRNKVGDELAKLLHNGKLAMIDLTDGIRKFSEEIDDLKTDIPLIWTFLAEFIERLIVDSKSDISFFKVIIDSSRSKTDVANCISMCLQYADERFGHDVIRSIMTDCEWSLADVVDDVPEFLRSKSLGFLIDEEKVSVNIDNFDNFRDDLMSLLPNDDEELNQFLMETFGLEVTQTERCVYFISRCVFEYLSDLTATDIINFLCKKKLFFVRLLDRRSEFEKQTLDALCDSFSEFKETGLMAVINGLSDNILSYDAFQQFIQRGQSSDSRVTSTDDSSCGGLATDVYTNMAAKYQR